MWSDLLHRWFFGDEAKSVMSLIAAVASLSVAIISTAYTLKMTKRARISDKYDGGELHVWMTNARRNYAETVKQKIRPVEPSRPRPRPEMPL